MVVILFLLLILPMLIIAISVRVTSKGPVLYWSDRVGQYNAIFRMPKFRSMQLDTPTIATHLMTEAEMFLTPIGRFLRISSLDELPQLYSILKGDMSFVGPRPALFNQKDLIMQRIDKGVDKLLPGATGWAQVNGRDVLSIKEKVAFDLEYVKRQSFWFDLKILWMTLLKVLKQDNVSH
jgi:O-antigen biosynthesis protein WbqP